MDEYPWARGSDLVVERVGTELVVYDELSRTAHSLSVDASGVWARCDGTATVAAIAAELELDRGLVEALLAELAEKDLLAPLPGRGFSRREAGLKLAKIGGVAFAAPAIYSVAIGPAIAAASFRQCNSSTDCAAPNVPNASSGTCVNHLCTNIVCFVGFGDCDGNTLNGCETNLNTSTANCGSCGHPCLGGQTCSAGVCH